VIRRLKTHIPWWLKLGGKLTLARLPVSYDIWRRIGLFEHGFMLDPGYALEVFGLHFERARPFLPASFTVLELGPGDSLATALTARYHGASRTWLLDAGAFASREIAAYGPLGRRLADRLAVPAFDSLEHLLDWSHATYLTEGLASFSRIPDASVDLVFSQAVLEHVRRHEFDETLRQIARVLAPSGVTSHRIDLQDHLDHSLHSLRFSRARWESPLFVSSGFYTNRLRVGQILERFRAAGLEVLSVGRLEWPAVPLRKERLDAEFAAMPDDELRVYGVDVLARRL
jgi:SAM-dependent methyltransferase